MTKNATHSRLQTGLALLAAVAAVVAAAEGFVAVTNSNHANDIAADANRVAQDANQVSREANSVAQANAAPKPHVLLVDTIRSDFSSAYDVMCLTGFGTQGSAGSTWQSDFALVVDVSNSGPVGIDVSDIGVTGGYQSGPTQPFVSAHADLFATRDAFAAWVNHVGPSSPIEDTRILAAQLPIHLDPGATSRIAIRGTVWWSLPKGMTPEGLYEAASKINPTFGLWFEFSDGNAVPLLMDPPKPYDNWPAPPADTAFTACPPVLPAPAW